MCFENLGGVRGLTDLLRMVVPARRPRLQSFGSELRIELETTSYVEAIGSSPCHEAFRDVSYGISLTQNDAMG